MKVSQNTRRIVFCASIRARAPARLARVIYLGEQRSLSRSFNRSILSILTTSRARALSRRDRSSGSIPPRPAAGLNPGRRCFAPVSLDRPICTASLFRSGKLGDWRLPYDDGLPIARWIDRFALRIAKIDLVLAIGAPCHRDRSSRRRWQSF